MAIDNTTRACSKCGPRPLSEFARHVGGKDGLYRRCRACQRDARKGRTVSNPERESEYRARHYQKNKDAHKDRRLRSEYGISLARFREMLGEQNGLCRICCRINDGHSLSVDHNHQTGAVRGLLCHQCNTGLGLFRESLPLFERAAQYLSGAA